MLDLELAKQNPILEKTLTEKEISPLIAKYLDHGFRQDVITLDSVSHQPSAIKARFLVKEHFLPSDGLFHLSGVMATLCLSQLGMVLASLECNLQSKPYDLYLMDSHLQFKKISRDLDFPATLTVVKHVTRKNQHFMRVAGSINGAFEASGTVAFKSKS